MIYMTPDNCNLIKGRNQEQWGRIITPASFANSPKTAYWCGDNEVYTGRYSFRRYFLWLWKMRPHRHSCVFVTCPDVVGDARRTLIRYFLLAWIIKLLGYPIAYVAQDGQEGLPFPPFDALFIGGSTEWKMSPLADACIRKAQRRGRWVHVGRVNSQKRMRHFKRIGVNSVDGTSLTYAPDRDFWRFQKILLQPSLFTLDD